MNGNQPFLKVRAELVRDLGSDEAILLAFISFQIKYRKKDSDGYSPLSTKQICEDLGWNRKRAQRVLKKLIEAKMLRLKRGVNQIKNNKYKIMT